MLSKGLIAHYTNIFSTLTTQDTIPRASSGSISATSDWQFTRVTANHYSNGPVEDVTSQAMTCYELNPGEPAPETLPVTAGGSVTFGIAPNIYHPGPVNVYMAKAPGLAEDFDGKGKVWFKIYEDKPTITSSSIEFPSNGEFNRSPISRATCLHEVETN